MLKRCLALVLLAVTLAVLPSCNSGGSKNIYVTEIVSRNKTLIYDKDGDSSDYIELYNAGETDVALHGWFLSDKEDKAKKYSFPDVTIKAGEYLVVFCSGKDILDEESGEIHTNFKLDGDGEVISLVSNEGILISLVEFGESIGDAAFGLTDDLNGDYVWFERGTPGEINSGNFYSTVGEIPLYEDITSERTNLS